MSRPRLLHRMPVAGALGRCDAPHCDRSWSTLQTFAGVRRRLCRAHRRCNALEVLGWSVPEHTDRHIPESRLVELQRRRLIADVEGLLCWRGPDSLALLDEDLEPHVIERVSSLAQARRRRGQLAANLVRLGWYSYMNPPCALELLATQRHPTVAERVHLRDEILDRYCPRPLVDLCPHLDIRVADPNPRLVHFDDLVGGLVERLAVDEMHALIRKMVPDAPRPEPWTFGPLVLPVHDEIIVEPLGLEREQEIVSELQARLAADLRSTMAHASDTQAPIKYDDAGISALFETAVRSLSTSFPTDMLFGTGLEGGNQGDWTVYRDAVLREQARVFGHHTPPKPPVRCGWCRHDYYRDDGECWRCGDKLFGPVNTHGTLRPAPLDGFDPEDMEPDQLVARVGGDLALTWLEQGLDVVQHQHARLEGELHSVVVDIPIGREEVDEDGPYPLGGPHT